MNSLEEALIPPDDHYNISIRQPWQNDRFIPEVLVRNKSAFDALPLLKTKVVMFNYFDLVEAGFPYSHMGANIKSALTIMKNATIILNSIGEDILIDKFDVDNYCKVAAALGAKIVLSPDDYVYASDDGDRSFQNYSYLRALLRTKKLINISNGRFEVIGLVLGRSNTMMEYYYSKLKEYGIRYFAFSCGDILKASRRGSVRAIRQFTAMCNKDDAWHMLIGLHARKHIKTLRPLCYTSSQWSMSASHYQEYNERYQTTSYKHKRMSCSKCGKIIDPITHIALHNLHSDIKFAQGVAA